VAGDGLVEVKLMVCDPFTVTEAEPLVEVQVRQTVTTV
jgi:hypothetical protein